MKHILEEILWQYVDGALDAPQRQTVERHTQQCATCRELLEEIQTFNTEIENTVVQAPSMRFSKNVMEIIEEEVSMVEYQPLFRKLWMRMLASGFAAIILGLVGLSLTAQSSEKGWVNVMNEGVTTFGTTIYGLATSTLGIIVILLALWVLFAFDKLFLSKRFG